MNGDAPHPFAAMSAETLYFFAARLALSPAIPLPIISTSVVTSSFSSTIILPLGIQNPTFGYSTITMSVSKNIRSFSI